MDADPAATPEPRAATPGLTPDPTRAADAEPPLPGRVRRGLVGWLLALLAGGVATTAAGLAEGAVLFAMAGLYVLAQTTDALVPRPEYRHWVRDTLPRHSGPGRLLRWMLRAVLPGFAALYLMALMLPGLSTSADGPADVSPLVRAWCMAGAVLALGLISRRVSDSIARVLFRVDTPTRTLRLTARIAVLLVLLCVPVQLRFDELMAAVLAQEKSLVTTAGLVAQLVGLVAIALAGVGAAVRRDLRQTLERLGVTRLQPVDALYVVGGVAACLVANAGLEQLEQRWFPAWYAADQAIVAQMAGGLSLAGIVVLGISAGVGEELFVRGALQPRLGLVLSNLLFAIAHVQYSWFGIGTVAVIGLVLGIVRLRRSTTAAILVHMLYNIVAAFGIQQG